MDSEHELKPGDLVRMCADHEMVNFSRKEISWCYGLYLGEKNDPLTSLYGWTPTRHDRVLHNGNVMVCDHYWHIERVS